MQRAALYRTGTGGTRLAWPLLHDARPHSAHPSSSIPRRSRNCTSAATSSAATPSHTRCRCPRAARSNSAGMGRQRRHARRHPVTPAHSRIGAWRARLVRWLAEWPEKRASGCSSPPSRPRALEGRTGPMHRAVHALERDVAGSRHYAFATGRGAWPVRQRVTWETKKLAKAMLGSTYLRVRKRHAGCAAGEAEALIRHERRNGSRRHALTAAYLDCCTRRRLFANRLEQEGVRASRTPSTEPIDPTHLWQNSRDEIIATRRSRGDGSAPRRAVSDGARPGVLTRHRPGCRRRMAGHQQAHDDRQPPPHDSPSR